MNRFTISVLIPFFNESFRLHQTIREIVHLPVVGQLVLVDDGSSDENHLLTIKKVKSLIADELIEIDLLRHSQNLGKLEAVRTGLTKVKKKTVLLLDADLQNLNWKDFLSGLEYFHNHNLSMLIYRYNKAFVTTKILGADFLLSGQRLITTKLLKSVLAENKSHSRYQLEVVINRYVLENKLKFSYDHHNADNYWKISKSGIASGLIQEIKMIVNIFQIGLNEYWKQIVYFIINADQKK